MIRGLYDYFNELENRHVDNEQEDTHINFKTLMRKMDVATIRNCQSPLTQVSH